MCGIAGVWSKHPDEAANKSFVESMVSELLHRGPDSQSVVPVTERLCFGHSRLSIQGLGIEGRQPAISKSGRYAITFNGEIYNHMELRRQVLPCDVCKSSSDTETILAVLDHLGTGNCFELLQGMFALAVWDNVDRSLTLARDRFGEKPLYYRRDSEMVAFSSEARPSFLGGDETINKTAMTRFLTTGVVPDNQCIFEGVFKVQPGEFTVFKWDRDVICQTTYKYFNYLAIAREKKVLEGGNYLCQLDQKLREVVEQTLIGDVDVGCFLSGGIDSTLICAYAAEIKGPQNLKTYTVGFDDKRFDESGHALAIAQYLGTNHNSLKFSEPTLRDTVEKIFQVYDEPFADSSQLPTYLVSQYASQDIKVCLSGDGGDEMWGGYTRYLWANDCSTILKYTPHHIRLLAMNLIRYSQSLTLKTLELGVGVNLVSRLRANVGRKADKIVAALGTSGEAELYELLTSNWSSELGLPLERDCLSEKSAITRYPHFSEITLAEQYMIADALDYLPSDILTKVDRAAMANSLEVRSPFLHPELVELASNIPIQKKIFNRKGKQPLRSLLANKIPAALFERPKMGFGIPLASYMRGPLKDMLLDLIHSRSFEQTDFMDSFAAKRIVEGFLKNQNNYKTESWIIFMLAGWLNERTK